MGEGVSVENRTLIENPRFLSFIDTIIIAHCSEIYSSRLNIRVAVSKRLQPFCSDMKGNLKVSKFRKQIVLFSFEPKTEGNYFLISALASKKSSNQKTLSYNYVK